MNQYLILLKSRRQTAPVLGISLLVLASFASAQTASADTHDPNWGASLHTEHCANCHTAPHNAAFYTSHRGKKIQNPASLRTMVEGCANHFNIAWFEEENEAVTNYLNVTYYKLK
ncbi:MAG TPA: hypothetical protein PLD79_05130 [Halothiobacillus sp.]|nr:hypothetical protein [Halothiobacillus sp.]